MGSRTILNEDVQALLDEEVVVEDDQSERERQHVVAGSDLQKLADSPLHAQSVLGSASQPQCPGKPVTIGSYPAPWSAQARRVAGTEGSLRTGDG